MLRRALSCKGVVGGDGDGLDDSDDEDSDGKVANVQYEPSDSPNLQIANNNRKLAKQPFYKFSSALSEILSTFSDYCFTFTFNFI